MAPLLAGQVINHARDLHPSLSTTNAPQQLAYRALSRFQRDLVEEITPRVPAYLAVEAVAAFPVSPFDAGISLDTLIPNGWKDLLDGFFVRAGTSPNPGGRVRGTFVPWEQRDMGQRLPAYTFQHNVLFFLGGPSYYANFATFNLGYTPLPADIVNDASPFILPPDCREALAAMLAAFYIKRLVGTPTFDVDAAGAGIFLQDAQDERAKFLTRIWRLGQRQNYRVRDVRGGGAS